VCITLFANPRCPSYIEGRAGSLILIFNVNLKEIGVCGIAGIAARSEVVTDLHNVAFKHQHRSHRSAGMVTFESKSARYCRERGIGRFTEVFTKERLKHLKGEIGAAHLRWATKGNLSLHNVQPLQGVFKGKSFYVGHNGEISFRRTLERDFAHYQPDVTADTKFILGLIEGSSKDTFEDALQYAFSILKGTYSLIILYENTLYAIRDVTGNRPLYLGRRNDAICAASESSAFSVLGIKQRDVREIEAGEMVVIHGEDLSIESKPIQGASGILRMLKICLIELMYSMYPTTIVLGRTVRKIREQLGWQLAQRYSPDADIVVGIPDSGLDAARGFAQGSGIPYKEGFRRYHQSGRVFYHAVEERGDIYRLKYDPDYQSLKNRRVVLVDDTMFASATMKKIMELCFETDVKEVHVGIPAPMIIAPCHYGTPTSSDHRRLVAKDHGGNLDHIKNEIGFEFGGRFKSLAFLSLADAKRAVIDTKPVLAGYEHITIENVCDACFLGGRRHIPVDID